MQASTLFKLIFALMLGGFLVSSCSRNSVDDDPTPDPSCDDVQPTWLAEIEPIVQTYCSYLGCHSAGMLSGDFTTYEKMKPFLDGGRVQTRVFDLNSMPPPNAPGPRELSEEHRQLLACWLEQGHPKE